MANMITDTRQSTLHELAVKPCNNPVSILQIRKLRLREVRKHVQTTQIESRTGRTATYICLSSEPKCLTTIT